MLLTNTTFVIDQSLIRQFIAWANEQYIASALASGIFSDPLLSRILTETEPGTTAFALQLRSTDHDMAADWHDGKGAELRNTQAAKWGDKFLHFSTFMEIVK